MRAPAYYLSRLTVLFLHFSIISVIYAQVVNDRIPLPRFLPTRTNLSVNAGDVAEIKCQIQNLGGRTVVWKRASEPFPLSIGVSPFTEKHRIRVEHRGQIWKIYIGNVQPRDSGVYECQISSKENLKKLFMLRVNGTGTGPGLYPKDVPGTSVNVKQIIQVRGKEVVEVGQPIRLECNTTFIGGRPQELDWFRDGDKITNSFSKKITIKAKRLRGSGLYTSRLEIKHSKKSDTGWYLCRNPDQKSARIYVDVLNTKTNNVKREGSVSATEGSTGGSRSSAIAPCSSLWWRRTVISSALLLGVLFRTVW